jgi:3-hydroxyisobutyrate dehydrogenase
MAQQEFDVAILGCGIMGSAIARRAQSQGLRTIAWDRTFERAREVGEGVEAAQHLGTAVSHAQVVVTMLADARAVLDVMDEQHGLDQMREGATWVQMATIGLQGISQAMQLASQRPEINFVDAPVSGTREPAEDGKLLILASANMEKVPDRVARFCAAIGQRTVWLGPAGRGTRMKLVLNTWLSELMEGLAETLAAGDTLDISAQEFENCIAGGPLAAPWALAKLKKIESDATADTEFPLKWATKDVRLAIDAVHDTAHQSLPALETIAKVWEHGVQQGLGDRDISAAYLALGTRSAKTTSSSPTS